MSVFAPGVVNLWKAIATYGIDPAPLFADEGIKLEPPIDPCTRLSYQKIDRIRAKAVELTADEAFGLRSAQVFAPSQFGALGYAWQASQSLRNACMRLERFVHVVNDKAIIHVEDKDACMVVTFKMNLPSEAETVRDDGALALVTMMSRLVYGDNFRLHAINFRHSPPKDTKPYFEFFGCELNFDYNGAW